MSKALAMQVYNPLLLADLILLSPLSTPPLILHRLHVLSSSKLPTPLPTKEHIQHQGLYTDIHNHGEDSQLLHALSFKFTI